MLIRILIEGEAIADNPVEVMTEYSIIVNPRYFIFVSNFCYIAHCRSHCVVNRQEESVNFANQGLHRCGYLANISYIGFHIRNVFSARLLMSWQRKVMRILSYKRPILKNNLRTGHYLRCHLNCQAF